mgnify:CR=1 FL=1
MENKYQQGKIYKIVCNITSEVYYGSTRETLNRRLAKHIRNNSCICRNIIERGDYKIELVKDYPCNNQYELEEEEGKYIRENECINITIPHRTKKEWYQDNKEKILEKQKEKILEKVKCECGVISTKKHLSRHQKSMKCIKIKTLLKEKI